MKEIYLAIDIGASSGRHIVGIVENGKMTMKEVFRFPNGVKSTPKGLVWDIEGLFRSVTEGIRATFAEYPNVNSLAIDTWGVDYVLMCGDKAVLPCRSYRDPETEAAIKAVHERIPFERLYKRTGIQFQPFNTVYQLVRDAEAGLLAEATDFLMIPEYLSYRLTGRKVKEYTNATTTGLIDAATGEFDSETINALDMLPKRLFGTLAPPGTYVGKLLPEIAEKAGGQTNVVLAPSHDTASAVEAVDGEGPYVSSGTWSLLGIKSPKAFTDEKSRRANWSNEGGVGYIRFQKNIMGMWLVQSLRKELCPDKDFSLIAREAEESDFDGVIDVNDEIFLAPQSMKAAFDGYFPKGKCPKKENDYFRCAYYGLAYAYDKALKELSDICGKRFNELTIVGGGAKNSFLNGLTEKVCKVKVNALPVEATAAGNLKTQIRSKEYGLL